MKNIELNPGGVIGALAFGGIAGTLLFMNVDPESSGSTRSIGKLVILAVVIGAACGNFFWGMIFSKRD